MFIVKIFISKINDIAFVPKDMLYKFSIKNTRCCQKN